MGDGSSGDLHGEGEGTPSGQAGDGAGEDQSQGGSDGGSQPKTVEEVEAIWRNRVSGKDRAHAAETKTLRDRIAALEASAAAAPKNGDDGSDDQSKAEIARLNAALEAERLGRVIDTRKAKYPFAADVLDDEAIAHMDEAKLAGLDARLNDASEGAPPATSGRPTMDPNLSPRSSRTPTPPTEKSVDELKSDLRKYAPEFLHDIS